MNNHQNLDRYAVQSLFAPIGDTGQRRISASSVTLIGCGALGSHLAQMMVRAGIGRLKIIDRDFLELSNLQRQTLFDEDDLHADLPKAIAAANKLRKINSQVAIDPEVTQASAKNIESLIAGADLILDGTDNLHTRYLINDAAIKHRIPWVYGACVGAKGLSLAILPQGKPCLRCVFDAPPLPDRIDTCRDIGIINPIVAAAAAVQAAQALKILTGNLDALDRKLVQIDLWENRTSTVSLDNLTQGCPCCRDRQFDFLDQHVTQPPVSLYSQNAVQIIPDPPIENFDLADIEKSFPPSQIVSRNDYLIRLTLEGCPVTLFSDGRAVILNTNNLTKAKNLYDQYINPAV